MSPTVLQKILGAGVMFGSAIAVASMFMAVEPRPAYAEACNLTKDADDLSADEVDKLYACMRDKLTAAYGKGNVAAGKDYTSWKAGSMRPAAPGPHGSRFLMTYVNDIGHAEYIKYTEGKPKMPVGTVIAKESFKANKKGVVKPGPLFLMTKLDDGKAAKYGDWLYGGVKPNGKVMKVSQKFCHDCHGAFDDQDSLGYPDTDVRIK
ncbi:MAG: cytochrome P460 family protein [Methyloligellaceae bacterium]